MKKTIILLTSIATIAQASVSNWPAASEWIPLFNGINPYSDIGHDALNTGKDDDNIDIVGSATNSAGFKLVRTENGEEQLLFRIRLDDYKKAAQPLYWQVFFNTDSDADLDFALELESGLDNNMDTQWLTNPTLRFTSVAAHGTDTSITLSTSNLWKETNGALYANWAGSTNGDVFVDMAMPAAVFYSATGRTSGHPFSVMLATSKTSGLIDGDMALHDGSAANPETNLTLFIPPMPGYIETLSPSIVGQLGGDQIVILGTDLGNGTLSDIQSITLNGIAVASIDSISTTQIIVTAAASTQIGTGDIVISSALRGVMIKENAFTYLHETPTHSLTIESEHGITTPEAGTYEFDDGHLLSLSVTTPIEIGTTQYVCTGWVLNDQETGTTSFFNASLTNDLHLTWQWTTNYWVESYDTSSTSQWVEAGATITLTPLPKTHYKFWKWSGDTSATNMPFALRVQRPFQVTAEYKELRTQNTGTPHWWLADNGYTNNFEEAAIEDADADDLSNWEEFIAGTDAKDKYSKLKLRIQKNSKQGHDLSWDGVAGREYKILWAPDLQQGITNTLVESYVPTESKTASIIDPRPEHDSMFYRIVVKLAQ